MTETKWDVVVAGGGLGGVSAAVASARLGAKTLLIERNSYVGGTATAGMCCSLFNCFYTSRRRLGSAGIPVEIADRLATATGYGKKWHDHKGHIIYDLEAAKLVLQEMLEHAGAELLLGVPVTGATVENRTLKSVTVASKRGSERIAGGRFVDATGDADVAFLAGAPLHTPDHANGSRHSLCFRLGNVDVDAFIDYFRRNPEEYPAAMDVNWTLPEALRQYDECGTFLFPHGGGIQMKAFRQAREDGALPGKVGLHDTTDACQMHGIRKTGIVHVITGYVYFDGLDPYLASRAIDDGRRMAFALAEVYRNYIPGFGNAYVAGVADNLGVRSSRFLAGDFVFTPEMTAPGTRFDDAVGELVPYRNQVLHPGKNAWGAHVMGEDTFDLPLRALLPHGIGGLIMGSGRSVSAADPWQLRVMAHTMAVGQAAGAAAAVSLTDVNAVQKALAALTKKELLCTQQEVVR